jgi:membrane associated rhomboid family serine protease
MIPLKDDNPTRSFPFVNIALILINIAVFIYQVSLPPRVAQAFVLHNATIPARIPAAVAGHAPLELAFLPLLTSMFLHSGLMHILGNMLFLWIFGDNVEDEFGHFFYLLFYIACGIGSGLLHVLFNLNSHIPAVGASGAISGVMGAYIVLFPRARVLTFFFVFLLPIPAFLILGYWFALQVLEALAQYGTVGNGGVAIWAHVGGFAMGVLIALMVKRR